MLALLKLGFVLKLVISKFCLFSRLSSTAEFVDLLKDPSSDLSSFDPVPSSDSFIDFLRRRALDDSVNVRKNALQVRCTTEKSFAA